MEKIQLRKIVNEAKKSEEEKAKAAAFDYIKSKIEWLVERAQNGYTFATFNCGGHSSENLKEGLESLVECDFYFVGMNVHLSW